MINILNLASPAHLWIFQISVSLADVLVIRLAWIAHPQLVSVSCYPSDTLNYRSSAVETCLCFRPALYSDLPAACLTFCRRKLLEAVK
jgi:hypothetical protein